MNHVVGVTNILGNEPSGKLGALIRAIDHGATLHPSEIGDAVAQEALARMAALDHACKPPSRERVLEWLKAIGSGVAKAPETPERLHAMCELLWDTCGNFPIGVWTRQTSIEFLRSHRFWPLPADLHDFLAPLAARLRAQRRACAAVVDVRRPGAQARAQEAAQHRPQGPRSMDELHYVRERVREVGGGDALPTGTHVTTIPNKPTGLPPVRSVEEMLAYCQQHAKPVAAKPATHGEQP
jgi:hypothetical protein